MPNGPFLYADQLLDVLTAKSEQGGFRSAPAAFTFPAAFLSHSQPSSMPCAESC